MVTTSWVAMPRAVRFASHGKGPCPVGVVQNDAQDVEIVVEGSEASRETFLRELKSLPPEAAPCRPRYTLILGGALPPGSEQRSVKHSQSD